MNQRVPDSGGLPLRAMVMVLLFLGVIFLLVGFQAVRTGGNSGNGELRWSARPRRPPAPTPPAPPKADVLVYNISAVQGAAARTGQRLRRPAGMSP